MKDKAMADLKLYSGMVHLNGHLMTAIDLETTGTQPGYHEIVQIAIVPLDADFQPLQEARPFYTLVKPEHPERASAGAKHKHKIPMERLMMEAPPQDKVKDWLVEWFEALRLPFKRCLVPLAHNWAFESSFLKAWLGVPMVDQLFHAHARDSMLYAVAINDRAACNAEPVPFPSVALGSLCNKLNIVNTNPHDALADCITGAKVYRTLLRLY